MRFRLAVSLLLLLTVNGFTQPVATDPANVWTLQRCVHYAVEHNISIKQDSLSARLAHYTLKQSELSQIPSLSATASYGRSFGRSINPATNQFVDASYNSLVPTVSGNVLLFGWLQVRNSIEKNRYALKASLADLDQLKDDISVNVANGFLAAVLAEEQINVSRNQVGLSKAQLDQTRAFADAGRLPELNVAQLESQLATDSSNLINAIATYNSSILDLKTLLNLDFSVPFTLQVPDVNVEDQFEVYNTDPAEIYLNARGHFGSIKASEFRVSAAQKGLAAAKGSLYPQLSLGYQLGTNWASNYETVTYVSGIPVATSIPFNTQFTSNVREGVFLTLNIPIFNAWQGQYAVRQAGINLSQSLLNEFNAELTLKQNVYKAHNNALNSIQKYYAAKRADEAAKRALDFARKRYDLGLTSTVDLLVTQNSEFAAAANLVGAKYDLIFKLKLVDYYMGKELKL